MKNNNGFADALEEINTLLKVSNNVEMDVLEEAANYFVEKLRPNIPVSRRNKKHIRDALTVVVKADKVSVEFEDYAWYWYLVEHGHAKANGKGRVPGAHFVQNAWNAYGDKVADIMADKIIEKLNGG